MVIVSKTKASLSHALKICQSRGLDLCAGLKVQDYNDLVPHPHQIISKKKYGVIIGNTKKLWPIFKASLKAKVLSQNPLDDYIEQVARELNYNEVYFAHKNVPTLLSFVKLAVAANLAQLRPTHMAVHPVFGPWFALRFIFLIDEKPDLLSPIDNVGCLNCDEQCIPKLKDAIRSGKTQDWMGVRDSCNIGKDQRYDEDQLNYHYTKNPQYLT